VTVPDIDNLASLGGILQNYRPVEDPTTDLDAGFGNKTRANAAAMTQTAPRAMVIFTTASTTGGLVLVGHWSLWGNTPTVAPSLARLTTGQYTVTWPATVTDELGVTHTVSLRAAMASTEGTTAYDPNAYPTVRFGNVVQANLFSASGSPTDGSTTTMVVWAY
jgi:hypothetical protein